MSKYIRVVALLMIFSVITGGRTVTAAGAEGRPVKAVISGIIGAYGGEKAVTAAKRVYAQGTITAFMRGDEGTYLRWFERGRRLRVETKYSRSSELRILNGSKGWRGVDGEAGEVNGFQYLAMIYQYKQVDILYGLMTGQYKVVPDGSVVDGVTSVDIYRLSDVEGPPMRIFVEPKSGLIVEIEGVFSVNGHETSLSAQFSDFRKVDGLKLPFKVLNFGGGKPIGETTIHKYEINPVFKNTVFKP